ncbi:VWA domain-containing protein [Umezawaea endophytica]|uniref:VWA domain-containing protein n=1 Tax=Umezawaea endophytica TaxID=1654476 RepID=A0A9X2VL13_9PSEU|nr:VWA domain-containing protein [Umezawaea endophytica]MCS7478497.1 VWA domain-containing protein [Umezawaea endophytica]
MADHPVVGGLVGFGRALRSEGLVVGTGDALVFCAAAAVLDPTDLADLYWAGRTALVVRRDDIPVYDEVFRRYFLGADASGDSVPTLKATPAGESAATVVVPATDPGAPGDQEQRLGLAASDVDVLRHRSFAACTDEELAALRRITARMRLAPPRRRSRRTRAATSGRLPDLRRTIRHALRTQGELVEVRRRRRRVRPRPLVLILDVSGSMADYSRALVQFAHTAGRATRRVEVFCFGTRLTRVTHALRSRGVDEALRRAADVVVDWEGGTRIGDSLDRFVRDRRGLSRGGVVVICSDGLDRGDPDVLATAMARLSRLCHRIVWLNPHRGNDPRHRPRTLGMAVVEPHVDVLLSGHDLGSLEEFAELLPALG